MFTDAANDRRAHAHAQTHHHIFASAQSVHSTYLKKKKNIIVYSKRACLIAPFETSVRVELHQMSLKICHMAGIVLEEDDYYGYLTELIYKPDAAETVIWFLLLLLFGG